MKLRWRREWQMGSERRGAARAKGWHVVGSRRGVTMAKPSGALRPARDAYRGPERRSIPSLARTVVAV